MSFFEGIGFENFRVIGNKMNFELAPITILTGTNNSGKSTVINGIKLLKENFREAKTPLNLKTDLDLESIVNRKIESGPLLEKYGNLGQFVKRGSEKEGFTFSFHRNLFFIDEVDISITIGLNKNNLKNGKIVKIEIQSLERNTPIFQIYERPLNKVSIPPTYENVIKIDLVYFKDLLELSVAKSLEYYNSYNKLLIACKEIVGKDDCEALIISKIESFNLKFLTNLRLNIKWDGPEFYPDGFRPRLSVHNFGVKPDSNIKEPGYLISEETLHLINAQQESLPGWYDFSFLWKDNVGNKKLFEEEILSHYSLPFNEAYLKFNEGIIKFLSEIEWSKPEDDKLDGVNSILNASQYSDGIGFKKFMELFGDVTQIRNAYKLDGKEPFKIFEQKISNAIENNSSFYNNIFKPFLVFVDKLMSEPYINSYDDSQASFFSFDPFGEFIESQTGVIIANMIRGNLGIIQSCISGLAGFEFLSSFRIIIKRVYSFADVDQFPVLIKGLEDLDEQKRLNAYKFINKWLKKFGIADNLEIEPDNDTGNFKPYFIKNGHRVLMADLGFGTSQILPLLLKLVPTNSKLDHLYDQKDSRFNSIIVIEEPEANLHPALQSKLADLFVEAINFGTQIIIETHSEYLIRKLQYLTRKGEIRPNFIQIYYFSDPDDIPEGEEQIKKININRDGSLTDNFGEGFFDEATSWKFELLKLNNPQKN